MRGDDPGAGVQRHGELRQQGGSEVRISVSDPFHFDTDPDSRIRFRDNGFGVRFRNKFQFFSS